ncbi:MAG: hypothetical protein WC823_06895 [Parcubacteria group bacterium]|jgi:hypothetical protein
MCSLANLLCINKRLKGQNKSFFWEMMKMDKNGCVGQIGKKTMAAVQFLLKTESRGRFEKHQLMKGVLTRKINRRRIPPEIMREIDARGKKVKSFFIIKTNRSIPVHPHDKISEMYVGGDGGIVTLQNPSQDHADYIMRPDVFTVVDAGGFHGVNLYSPIRESLFLGIKLEEKLS